MELTSFLDKGHLTQLLRSQFGPSVEVLSVEPYDIDNSASILVTLTAQETERRIGHFGLKLQWKLQGEEHHSRLVLKVKPPGCEIATMLAGLAEACDKDLSAVYAKHMATTGFANTHLREIEVYKNLAHDIQPKLIGYLLNSEQEQFELLIEDLCDCELLNSVMNVEHWSAAHIYRALSDLAKWHVFAKDRTHLLNQSAWADTDHQNYMQQEAPIWRELLSAGSTNFPEFYSSGVADALAAGLDRIDGLASKFASLPKTLIHNDANPRNACFRSDGSFCLYDWELSCQHVPVYDVIELLAFVLEEDRFDQLDVFLNHYRNELAAQWDVWNDDALWQQSLELAWYAFGWHRLGMYTMAHAVAPYPFLPRVFRTYGFIGKHLKLVTVANQPLLKESE